MAQSPYFIESTESTNNILCEISRRKKIPEGFVVYTDYQTAGKGQTGNSWESEKGKNILFSILLYPHHITVNKQFLLSQITCLAIKNALDEYTADITIKWPNDLYWKDKKICGILIENSLVHNRIDRCVIGIGLNVNQITFSRKVPNPVSLKQITGLEIDREEMLFDICERIIHLYHDVAPYTINNRYMQNLYRAEGYHPYLETATGNKFIARIENVDPDGKLILISDEDERKEFYFKEVQFII